MKKIVDAILVLAVLGMSMPSLANVKVVHWAKYVDTSRYPHLTASVKKFANDVEFFESNAETAEDLANDLSDATAFVYNTNSSSAGASYYSTFSTTLRDFVEAGGIVITTGDFEGWVNKVGLMNANYSSYSQSGSLTPKDSSNPLFDGIGDWSYSNYWPYYTVSDSDATVLATINGSPAVVRKDIGSGFVLILGYDFYYDNDAAGRIFANALSGATPGYSNCKPKVTLALDKKTAKAGEVISSTASVSYACDKGRDVEVKFWQIIPKKGPMDLLAGSYLLSLVPEDQFEDKNEIQVPKDAAAGAMYRVGFTLIDPVTGETLAKDIETYKVAAP